MVWYGVGWYGVVWRDVPVQLRHLQAIWRGYQLGGLGGRPRGGRRSVAPIIMVHVDAPLLVLAVEPAAHTALCHGLAAEPDLDLGRRHVVLLRKVLVA